jgi:hypothetical protein
MADFRLNTPCWYFALAIVGWFGSVKSSVPRCVLVQFPCVPIDFGSVTMNFL